MKTQLNSFGKLGLRVGNNQSLAKNFRIDPQIY